ncbi:hypothetical protein [Halobaculum sp. D14]|uniref:hypothetical protein n=1 Tax=unclassified Halobaculum TaxID=2640896 RepID=UPI003EB89059
MTVRVFELRGVYVFRFDGDVPPSLARHYNDREDRYELPTADALDDLPVAYDRVDDPDRFRVSFRGDPPEDVADAALLVDEGPVSSTVLCPDEDAVEAAVAAGGERVEPDG